MPVDPPCSNLQAALPCSRRSSYRLRSTSRMTLSGNPASAASAVRPSLTYRVRKGLRCPAVKYRLRAKPRLWLS